jgi:predicted permease
MSFWNRLFNTLRSGRLDNDLQREMETHLAKMQDDELRSGADADQARRSARLQFGNPGSYREETRERNLFAWLEIFLQDFRYTLRQLRNAPGFTLTTVLILALGIGVNVAIFTLLNSIVLHSLPLPNPGRLVIMLDRHSDGADSPPSWLDQQDFREQNHVFASLGAYSYDSNFLLQAGNETRPVGGSAVTPDYFSTLGVKPIAGRLFSAANSQPGQDNVALLREDFWRSQFGSDPEILGKTITLNGRKYTLIGILPKSFRFPRDGTVLWTPLVPTAFQRSDRGWHGFPMVGRLKPGVTLQQAHADLDPIMARMARTYPDADTDRNAVLLFPLREWNIGHTGERLLILQYAALAIFLMMCANVSSLVLARYSSRRREFAMRAALGASRMRLIRQHLTDALVLAASGCFLSAVIAWSGVRFLVHLYGNYLPRTSEIGFDSKLLLFGFGITILTATALGLTTALHENNRELESALRERSRAAGSRRSTKMRKILVAIQAACALTLVCGGIELVQSFRNLMQVNPGLDASHLLTMRVSLPESQYKTGASCSHFFVSLTDRLNHIPGVQSAASINMLPVQMSGTNGDVEVPGLPPHSSSFFAEYRWITGNYLRTMGIPLVRGRNFLPEELAGKRLAIIINETMARTLWKDRDPIGWTVKSEPDFGGKVFTVIGIAHDVKQAGLNAPTRSEYYMALPTLDESWTEQSIAVRTTLNASEIMPAVRREVRKLDPGAAIFGIATMHEVIADSVSYTKMLSVLLSAFAALALIIAAFGLYGVMSYLVNERTRELAIRQALGATGLGLTKLVFRQSLAMLAGGLVLGALGAVLASRSLASMLYGMGRTGASSFFIAACVLLAAAVLGIAIPALRAAKVDPMQALRQE